MRKVDNPKCKVLSLIVDAATERCVVASLDISGDYTSVIRSSEADEKLSS